MAKLSKAQIKQHESALKLLENDILTYEEKVFVYENYQEGFQSDVIGCGIHFTPFNLANDFKIDMGGKRIIDLCAGIGTLSFCYLHHINHWDHRDPSYTKPEIVCVELNHDFVEIGKKLLPEATWVQADALDYEFLQSLGYFDYAIANPPFGNVKTSNSDRLKYTGKEFEFRLIEVASTIADNGTFILPQQSAGFVYSGQPYMEWTESRKYQSFKKQTNIELQPGCGIDTSIYKDEWKSTNIITEVCYADFTELYQENDSKEITDKTIIESNQLSLF